MAAIIRDGDLMNKKIERAVILRAPPVSKIIENKSRIYSILNIAFRYDFIYNI